MLNDDVTTMEFVITCPTDFFEYTEEQAKKIVVDIPEEGSAPVATYPTKLQNKKESKVTLAARQEGYPKLESKEDK